MSFFNFTSNEIIMQVTVSFNKQMPLCGINEKQQKTFFDTSREFQGTESAASPVETVLEALGACSMMDIISILRKMRREPLSLTADIAAQRAKEHPKVFTSIEINYRLECAECSPDDLEKAVALSMEKYCTVAAILRNSGCQIHWSSEII